MEDLIRKIQIHLETTEECIENTSLPQYVVELLEADNKLLSEVVTNYQTEKMYSEEDLRKAFSAGRTVYNYKGEWEETYSDQMTSSKYEDFIEWFEQFKKK